MNKTPVAAALLFLTAGLLSAVELPESVAMTCGDIKIRLDARKRWNINRIEWKGQLVCIDTRGAHYGMTCRPAGSPHFIGSGHTESGAGEEVISIKLFADGKEVVPGTEPITGKSVGMEKVSSIYKFKVKYSFTIADNVLAERTEITSPDEAVPLRQLYCFMHPWSTRFTDYHVVSADGKKSGGKFVTDGKHRNRAFAPLICWYDAKSAIIVSTAAEKPSWSSNLQRLLWDIRSYRKDYICLVMNGVFPANTTAVCRARTAFARQKDPGKWVADAEALGEKLQSGFAAQLHE
ncbi:MAG: hypothetical protein IJS01_02260 [Lentisphaeria bacterium]|nr:hypothetical protein [Lentisphaeria bacterium]